MLFNLQYEYILSSEWAESLTPFNYLHPLDDRDPQLS